MPEREQHRERVELKKYQKLGPLRVADDWRLGWPDLAAGLA